MKFRSKFLSMSLCLIGLTGCNNNMDYVSNDPRSAEAGASTCYDVNDLYKTYSTFFKPAQGWVGDPMPFYENGKFHVFYLHDARDGSPTFHPWYKATTENFSTFTDNGEMIPTGTIKQQDRALGTGSVFKHNGVYYGFYTGHNGDIDPHEKIMLATSTDLNTWTKDPSFHLAASDGYDRNEFRDPLIIKDEASGTFRMLISTRANYKGSWRAVIAQYTSTDLRNWKLIEPFYDDPNTFMLECPDVFTMGDYQYLIYSNIDDRKVHYQFRKGTTGAWTIPTNSALDGIAFYAGKTASDGTDRYITAWCPTREKHSDYKGFDWAGSLITHKLIQFADGTISMTYPHSLNDKLSNSQNLNMISSVNTQIESNSFTLKASAEQAVSVFDRQEGPYKIAAKVKASTSNSFGFEFGSCGNRREVYAVVFDLEQQQLRLERRVFGEDPLRIDNVKLNVPDNKEFDVTIMVENSICVVYVNHQTAFTNRIYKMNGNPWGIFSDNGEVTFSNLNLSK